MFTISANDNNGNIKIQTISFDTIQESSIFTKWEVKPDSWGIGAKYMSIQVVDKDNKSIKLFMTETTNIDGYYERNNSAYISIPNTAPY